ncbi:XP_039396470.1uncharacterized protein LOC120406162 [Podarcis lilfordi]|uniref:XP_039396470.1uncharacterized protein LOC120406162 n=1 Tax=Podarcis lilfordi TaxID=74358 RepID=A0AA35PE85_9SAUR|nr:XP_039396470.1uncharacterized protein LOC120406162 [Podarcis lilfordi]
MSVARAMRCPCLPAQSKQPLSLLVTALIASAQAILPSTAEPLAGGANKDGAASKAKPSEFAIDLINQETKDSVLPGEIVLMPTQLAGPLPPKVAGLILPKFSAAKEGIQVIPGVLDPDYVGTIMVQLWSHMPMQLKRLLAVVQRIGEKKLLLTLSRAHPTFLWPAGSCRVGTPPGQLVVALSLKMVDQDGV